MNDSRRRSAIGARDPRSRPGPELARGFGAQSIANGATAFAQAAGKPKAAMIKEAAKREKVSLNDLVIFDDSLVALRSIKKLGVKKIYALNPKGIDIEKEKLADRVIRDYTGITLAEL